MFRRDRNYRHVDSELAGRAFAGLYALHGHLVKKEKRTKGKKKK